MTPGVQSLWSQRETQSLSTAKEVSQPAFRGPRAGMKVKVGIVLAPTLPRGSVLRAQADLHWSGAETVVHAQGDRCCSAAGTAWLHRGPLLTKETEIAVRPSISSVAARGTGRIERTDPLGC